MTNNFGNELRKYLNMEIVKNWKSKQELNVRLKLNNLEHIIGMTKHFVFMTEI